MARKKSKAKGAAFMVFNVIYEDGTISSNRRVPNEGQSGNIRIDRCGNVNHVVV